jgi:hypothetical protein
MLSIYMPFHEGELNNLKWYFFNEDYIFITFIIKIIKKDILNAITLF